MPGQLREKEIIMTSFVHLEYSMQHPGVVRAGRAVDTIKGSGIVALAHSLGQAVRKSYEAWIESRRQASEDDKLWQLALTDARVMAELSRAMSSDAANDLRKYY